MPNKRVAPLWRSGLLCRCPRCGLGSLYSSYLKVAPRCTVCTLDLSFAEQGDGPAVFVIMIAGTIIVGSAMFVELRYAPPFWLHALIWGPLTIALCLGLLPVFKALLIALQYRFRHDEGRWE
jgi:uncharacterized protein (DUF983 family)